MINTHSDVHPGRGGGRERPAALPRGPESVPPRAAGYHPPGPSKEGCLGTRDPAALCPQISLPQLI